MLNEQPPQPSNDHLTTSSTKPEAVNNPLLIMKHQPINGQTTGLSRPKRRSTRTIVQLIAGLIVILAGSGIWYNLQLKPVGSDPSQLVAIKVESGMTPSEIGKLLADKSIIRNALAFDIYTRLSGERGSLQAGSYRLSPAESTPTIVNHLVSGRVDTFNITFLPGATLADDHKVLENAGFSKADIDNAFAQTYTSPLFAGKPAGADLEGYIYGQTYRFNVGATVSDILQSTFKQFYADLVKSNLIDSITQHNLTLFQGITLASIIQKEASNPADQTQVAQVFYSRLQINMPLGSDVTYQYIADKTGVARDPNLDSPYNTRRYPGLPPGPISSPGLTALQAVAHPAAGDYLYFLNGDDNIMYYAHTSAEHEANIKAHCQVKCSQL